MLLLLFAFLECSKIELQTLASKYVQSRENFKFSGVSIKARLRRYLFGSRSVTSTLCWTARKKNFQQHRCRRTRKVVDTTGNWSTIRQ